MAKQWYEFDYTLLFGEGDSAIGGEHGTDFDTPIDTPITFLLSGTITNISRPSWGLQVTWKLDTPYLGTIPYAYQIHLDAINPDLQVGSHVKAGDLLGWSGGAISNDQIGSATNPTETHFLDSSEMSGGPHVEFGFCYGPVYGEGTGFVRPSEHPELNPKPFLDAIRVHGLGGDMGKTIDLTDPVVPGYFSITPDGQWQSKRTGFIVRKGILSFYCSYGKDAYCGLTYLGLPLSNEIPIAGHPGVVKQEFERGWLCYDPTHVIDHPPGAGDVYLMRLPR
jgi:hypothetical protein